MEMLYRYFENKIIWIHLFWFHHFEIQVCKYVKNMFEIKNIIVRYTNWRCRYSKYGIYITVYLYIYLYSSDQNTDQNIQAIKIQTEVPGESTRAFQGHA